jgi:predicted nuclease with RNAse H fold
MTSRTAVWIGADPGGKKCFGLAIVAEGSSPTTACVDCAEEAVGQAQKLIAGRKLAGVGVDAPLWWSSGRGSDRAADQWLRRRYRLPGGEVQAANSLKGAALVQASMFIERIRETFGRNTPVTEVHPKALLKGVFRKDWVHFAALHGIEPISVGEHERDAVIAAIAAREGFGGRWLNDLSLNRLPSEQNPQSYWLAPVHYFWPET